jgi:hypothetical protein
MKRITFLITPALFRNFKRICFDKDISMSWVLVGMVNKWVKKNS